MREGRASEAPGRAHAMTLHPGSPATAALPRGPYERAVVALTVAREGPFREGLLVSEKRNNKLNPLTRAQECRKRFDADRISRSRQIKSLALLRGLLILR